MKNKMICIVFSTLLSILLGGIKTSAEVVVPEFSKFGTLKYDYIINNNQAVAMNFPNEPKYDLIKDIVYIGYRGSNPEEDFLFNGEKMIANQEYVLKYESDRILIKKMGIINGRAINATIRMYKTSFLKDLKVTITPQKENLIQINNTFNLNNDVRRTAAILDLIYEDTGKPVEYQKKNYMIPTSYTADTYLNDYDTAQWFDPVSKLLIGDQPRDKNTLEYIGRKREINDQYIGFGKNLASYLPFEYSFLTNSSSLSLAGITYKGNDGSFNLFKSIKEDSSFPLPYDCIEFSNMDIGDNTIQNSINYYIPKQAKDSFIPDKVTINDQKNITEDLKMSKHQLFVDDQLIDESEYQYSKENYLELSKAFLKKYQQKTIRIVSDTQINYSNQKILDNFYNKESKKFDIPYNLNVNSYFGTYERIELNKKSIVSVDFPLKLMFTDLHKEVELGKQVTSYPAEEYITDITSNFPSDDVSVSLDNVFFNKFQETTSIPATLTSKKLSISQSIELNVNIYKKVPIKFKKDTDDELIPSEEHNIPKFYKHFINKEIKFNVPQIFDNYRFSSLETKDLTAIDTESNTKEISGIVNRELNEITLIYTPNETELAIEFLLEGDGSYESYTSVKQGKQLDKEKKTIKKQAIIGSKLADYIEANQEDVIPDIPYYISHKNQNLIANYWHYSDVPVGIDNSSNPVKSDDIIPNRPITITTVYSGVVSLEKVDNVNFGSHKNDLLIDKIISKKPITYRFIDTTKDKGIKVYLKYEKEIENEKLEQLKSFELEYKGNSITNKEVEVIESTDKESNIFIGDLSSDLLFKRYWIGPENFGKYEGTLVWSLARDITF